MPIVGPASAARSLRAEVGGGRAASRSPNPPISSTRPAVLVEPPPVVASGSGRLRVAVPILPDRITKPAEQEAARTVIRAYQATREIAPPPSQPVPESDAAPAASAPARTAAREPAARPAVQEETGEQRPVAPTVAGMVTAAAGAVRQLTALPAQAQASDKSAAGGKAVGIVEPPFREGGWTEAVTLLTIVAAICLGVWMLF